MVSTFLLLFHTPPQGTFFPSIRSITKGLVSAAFRSITKGLVSPAFRSIKGTGLSSIQKHQRDWGQQHSVASNGTILSIILKHQKGTIICQHYCKMDCPLLVAFSSIKSYTTKYCCIAKEFMEYTCLIINAQCELGDITFM